MMEALTKLSRKKKQPPAYSYPPKCHRTILNTVITYVFQMATVELYLYVCLFIINLPQGKDQYKRLEPVQGTARSTTTQ